MTGSTLVVDAGRSHVFGASAWKNELSIVTVFWARQIGMHAAQQSVIGAGGIRRHFQSRTGSRDVVFSQSTWFKNPVRSFRPPQI
jgi:hypothetical protein